MTSGAFNMSTNKDIEEAFCAAFSHLFDDGDELVRRAKWVARGFFYLDDQKVGGNATWDALILQRYEFKVGHGKTTPELDVRLLELVCSKANHGHAINLLNTMNKHCAPSGVG